MLRVIVVAGVPGSGKTTVCNELVKIARKIGKKVEVLNFGTTMLKIANKRGKLIHRDEIREFPLELQQELQNEAAKYISEKASKTNGNLIIDTHMLIRTKDGYFTGLPLHILHTLQPKILVLIEAGPSEILARRFKNANRVRNKVMEDEIAEELDFSKFIASTCAVLTGAPLKVVKNYDGKQIEAAKQIAELLV